MLTLPTPSMISLPTFNDGVVLHPKLFLLGMGVGSGWWWMPGAIVTGIQVTWLLLGLELEGPQLAPVPLHPNWRWPVV